MRTGAIAHGLRAHPKRQHIVYPVGCMIVVENITTKQQDFLRGHSNTVTCLDIARSGSLIASGQVTYMGFKVHTPREFLFPVPDLG